MKFFRSVIAIIFLSLANAALASAWGFAGGPVADEHPILPSRELDFVAEKAVARAPAIHKKAREFVHSLDTAPSCVRSAAFGLIKDCSSLDSKASKGFEALDSIKTLYAARLAICELKDAGLDVPTACTSNVLEPSVGGFLTMKSDPKGAVASCVKALESRPQSWTSYSNSRQNALLICQAARPESEREDMIKMFKSLVDNNEASEETLAQQVLFSKQQLAEQRALATELQSFSNVMSNEIKAELEAAHETFNRLQSRASAAEAEVADMFAGIANQVTADMQLLFETILQHKAEIQDAGTDISAVVSSLAEQGAAVSAGWREDMDKHAQVATQAHESLAGLFAKHDSLHSSAHQLHEEIEASARAQRQAQEELNIVIQDIRATATAINASVVGIATAVEAVSVYAGFLSWLAASFKAVLKWTVRSALLVLVVVSSVLGGRRGLIISTSVVLIFQLGNSAIVQARIRETFPLNFANADLKNDDLVRSFNLFIAVAMVVCLAVTSRRRFASLERRLTSQSAQDQEESARPYPSSLPRFNIREKQRELTIHHYDPHTDGFNLTAPS